MASVSQSVTIALIYTRVSSEDQKREGLSLDAQLADSRRYAVQHGWMIGGEFQDVMSGKRDDRPQYQALLAEVRRLRAEGRLVVVVVLRLDRFGRRLLERVQRREEFKALGVAVHSVREGEVNDMVASFLALMAEDEVRRLGERVADARKYVADRGWRPVGDAAWGYRWRAATEDERKQGAPKSVLEIDPEMAPYVREAFELAANGASIRAVTRWIASLPSDARGGRVMTYQAVRLMLQAPVYIARRERSDGGDVQQGEPQRWPALIGDATWSRARARIGQHARVPRQASGRYLLTGFIRCSLCGARMNAWDVASQSARRRSPRYRCEGEGRHGCRGSALLRPVDEAVLAEVRPVVAAVASEDPDLRSALRREWRALQRPTSDDGITAAQIHKHEREATQARRRLTRAAVMLVDREIDKAGYELARDQARADLDAAEEELARLRAAPATPSLPALDQVLRDAGGWSAAFLAADVPAVREILAVLIDTVVPERRGWGRYETRITWSPTGEALRQLAPRPATDAAA
jgi:DNA invertase Pin-like site-specific DNA recombinase